MFDFNVAFDKQQIHKSWVRGAGCKNKKMHRMKMESAVMATKND